MTALDIERERKLAALLDAGLDAPPEALEEKLSAISHDRSLIAEALAILRDERETHAYQISRQLPAAVAGARAAIAAIESGTIDAGTLAAGVGPPLTIGPYRIERVIGTGGMGVVYEAFQTKPVERRVAIKLMRSALTRTWERTRFQVEQRALARLAHPNVAQMFEAGMTDSGRPYVVMELVPGPPLTLYCDRHRLGLAPRLALFVDVCRAIEHAHRRQLLHRDLKPSNVLVADVGDGPVPKVIDFGIAKLLDADADVTSTIAGNILGTPAYMSPEALEGIDVDTRSDVYALGVLLYELLCGNRPFGSRKTSAAEIMRQTRFEEPTRPSRRLTATENAARIAENRRSTPADLGKTLAADLDWIALRALAKDRSNRYESSAALADDIERYLTDRPVEARPPSLRYRAGKLIKRHRAATFAALVAMIAATVAVVFALRYTIDVKRERSAAEAARLQAEKLVTFLLDDLYAELEPFARRDFLDRVATEVTGYFDDLPESMRSESAIRHAQALRNLGRVKIQEGAIGPARVAIEAALALDRQAASEGAGREAIEGMALDYRRMADVLERLGLRDETLAYVQRALELRRRLLDEDPRSIVQREEMAWDLSELGWARRALGNFTEAIEAFEQSTAIRRSLLESELRPDGRHKRQKWLGATLKDLAATLSMDGDPAAGEVHAREAVEILGGLAAESPARTDYAGEAAEAWRALASVSHKQGKWRRATEEQRNALGLFERIVASDPSNSRAGSALALCHLEIARLERLQNNPEGATASLRRTLRTLRDLPEELPYTVIEVEALLELGRIEDARVGARLVIDAGWYETRPRLAELLRNAGLL